MAGRPRRRRRGAGIAKWMKVLLCESGSAPAIRRQNDRKRILLSLRLSWNCLRFSGKILRFHFYCVQLVKYQYHAIEFSLCQKSGSTRTTSGKKDAIKHGWSSLNCGDKRARWRPQRQWTRRALQNRSGAKKHLTAHRLWLASCLSSWQIIIPSSVSFKDPARPDRGPEVMSENEELKLKGFPDFFHLEWTAWIFFQNYVNIPQV